MPAPACHIGDLDNAQLARDANVARGYLHAAACIRHLMARQQHTVLPARAASSSQKVMMPKPAPIMTRQAVHNAASTARTSQGFS